MYFISRKSLDQREAEKIGENLAKLVNLTNLRLDLR